MSVFQEIKLVWNGREYVIPPERVLLCIAAIEEVITLARLHKYTATNDLPLAKLAQAFAVALRHAGAHVTDEQVYESMFTKGELKARALTAVLQLQTMMLPPAAVQAYMPAPKGGKAAQRRATGASSKRRTS